MGVGWGLLLVYLILGALTLHDRDAPATDVAVGERIQVQVPLRQAGGLDIIIANYGFVHFYQGNVIQVIVAVIASVVDQPLDDPVLGIWPRFGALGCPNLQSEVLHLKVPG